MSVKGLIQEAAGYIEEEIGELTGSCETARDGRQLRNKGRAANDKSIMRTAVGHGVCSVKNKKS